MSEKPLPANCGAKARAALPGDLAPAPLAYGLIPECEIARDTNAAQIHLIVKVSFRRLVGSGSRFGTISIKPGRGPAARLRIIGSAKLSWFAKAAYRRRSISLPKTDFLVRLGSEADLDGAQLARPLRAKS